MRKTHCFTCKKDFLCHGDTTSGCKLIESCECISCYSSNFKSSITRKSYLIDVFNLCHKGIKEEKEKFNLVLIAFVL